MLEFGTIVEIKEGKALARVNILGRVTDFLPILAIANSFKRTFVPLRVDEQVAVLDDLLILGSVFNRGCSEPAGNFTKEMMVFEDGTQISYDTSTRELNITAVNAIVVNCKSATLNATTTTVNSDTTTITSQSTHNGDVTLNGNLLINGGINVAGGDGGSGAVIRGDVRVEGNINTTGNITDSKGNLTNHTNEGRARD